MRLVVGLGNPGLNYVGTRHNVGFVVARVLADRWTLELRESSHRGDFATGQTHGADVGVLLPSTFMNASGEAVLSVVNSYPVAHATELLVIYDDLDLPFGRLRLRAGGGCGGHRGMESIAAELGGEEFARLRFGIGRPQGGADVVEYVLAPFAEEEAGALRGHVERAADAVEAMMFSDPASAMGQFNRPDPADDSEDPTSSSSDDSSSE
ncbi:MAG: aminoacyl-tRNA hydrolase [Myxococcota bacterium]|nr:aminoacyl-tRNA hydrolase [Myxococcota bacterium]